MSMWSILLLLSIAPPDPVASQSKPRLILQGGSNPCEGYIEIYREGQWGIVGDNRWNKNNEDVVCKSIGCGTSLGYSNILRPDMSSIVWLNELNCNGTENQLWDCQGNRGWGVSVYNKQTVKKIQCSDKIETSLDGFRCAGAVQYKKTSNGETSHGYFCHDKWTKVEAELVCKTLKCGNFMKIPDTPVTTPITFQSSAKTKISCLDTKHERHLWQCMPRPSSCLSPVSVICSDHHMLRLKGRNNLCAGNLEMEEGRVWKPVTCQNKETSPDQMCKQMHCGTSVNHTCGKDQQLSLTCSEAVNVTLMDDQKPSRCYGAVHIEIGDPQGPRRVCASSWGKKNGEVVCRELGCGRLISTFTQNNINKNKAILDQVECSGDEASLWHCTAKYDRNSLSCHSTANVVCADSVKVRLSDGPGKCAGRVEFKYDGQWKRATKSDWTDINSDVVCNDLKCGNAMRPTGLDKFTHGSAPFLDVTVTCKPNSTISDCITEEQSRERDIVEITCQKHKVVFLKGKKSCSGWVGVAHAGETYWLSGSSETWTREAADAVCRQMHCGNAKNFTSILRNATMENEAGVWRQKCSFTESSLFDCPKNSERPLSWNTSIAAVTCSNETSVTLKNQCWGKVEMCVEGKCGGVCADAWTESKSKMLCENLGCGHSILPVDQLTGSGVSVKSLHTTQQTTNLAESNIVMSDGKYCDRNPARVVCSGSIKANFKASGDHCTGNLEMFYQGQWLPVCRKALTDINVQNTICRDLHCGQAVKALDVFGPLPESTRGFVSALQCAANKDSLAACNITSQVQRCPLGGLQCSDWRKMGLKQPKKSEQACEGALFVQSEGRVSYVSSEGWTDKEHKMLCRDLSCSNYKLSEAISESSSWWEKSFNCTNAINPRNIWDCERETTPSLKEQLKASCKAPNVSLSNKCSGEVKINGLGVCDSHWDIPNSHIVCQELMCSNAIAGQRIKTGRKAGSSSVNHVNCEGTESTLGQCKRTEGKCSGELVSVYCADCVKFNTTEKCGGLIQVQYRDKWEFVCPLKPSSTHTDNLLCEMLKCGNVTNHIGTNPVDKVDLETSLICSKEHLDIRNCVNLVSCGKAKPAEIYCSGYEIKLPPTQVPVTLIVGLSLGGLFLIMVIFLFLFLRGCILKNVKSRTTRKVGEYESGDYEDVGSNTSQMKDLIHMGSRPETAVMRGNDERRASSFSYDDIDEEAVAAQPLASEGQAANEAIADNINKYAAAQSADAVSYEVDDPQDNYDDITDAQVEVHTTTETQPGNDHKALPGGLQLAEDYLEPDQDG